MSEYSLIWGDVPFIRKETIQNGRSTFQNNNVFTFVTAETETAYTRVIRNKRNKVFDVIETEEIEAIKKGERDNYLFLRK